MGIAVLTLKGSTTNMCTLFWYQGWPTLKHVAPPVGPAETRHHDAALDSKLAS